MFIFQCIDAHRAVNCESRARKYIRILNLTIGLVDEEKAVMISQTGENDFDIKFIDMKGCVDHLLEIFDFAGKTKESMTSDGYEISSEQLEYEFGLQINSFRLKTKDSTKETDELYFLSGRQLYVYDFQSYKLYPESYADIVCTLNERMGM